MDRITAVKSIARNLRDLVVDTTVASPTGTSVDALKLIHPDSNQLRGFTWYPYSGGGAGQERTITEFQPANNRCIFSEVLNPVPSTNTNFVIFQQFDKLEYDNALDRAIGLAKRVYLEDKVATMQLVATQYEYPVPSGMEFISTLRLVPSGNTDYENSVDVDTQFEFPPRFWRINPNAQGSQVIIFDVRKLSLDDYDKEWVNVVGQSPPSINGTDNATIPASLEEYVIAQASALLASQRINESKEWYYKFNYFKDTAKSLENSIFVHKHGKQVGQ